MEMLLDWFRANQLSINLEKTVMMQFWSKHDKIKIRVMDNPIPYVQSTKFLGVFIDDTLSWKNHVEYTRSRITRTCLYQIITYFEGYLPHQKSLH